MLGRAESWPNRTDVPVPFEPDALRYRGASRERCFELFTRLGFRSLVLEYAPTADTIGKDYATVGSLDELRTLEGAASGRALRLPRVAGQPCRDACRHRRDLLLPDRDTPAMCRLVPAAGGDLLGSRMRDRRPRRA
jgi:hypothetical protein